MATLADIRKQREAGASVKDLGGISIAEAFGADEPVKHRRNHPPARQVAPVDSRTTGAVNATQLPSWELRRRRAGLLAQLAASEWEWDQEPTELGTMTCASLRAAISRIEQAIVERS